MNFAWEVTIEDEQDVLTEHGMSDDAEALLDLYFEAKPENVARVERAVLHYSDFDDQGSSALDEIETILLEATVVTEKRFSAP